jgi:hypothetical protein
LDARAHRFCNWVGKSPDELIIGCLSPENEIDVSQVLKLQETIGDFIGDLQAEGRASGTIKNHVKGVKALFSTNKITLDLPRLSKRVQYKDRAPAPDELVKIID